MTSTPLMLGPTRLRSEARRTPPVEVSPPAADAVLEGFHEVYRRIGVSAERLCQASGETHALAALLVAKGILREDELDARRQEMVHEARTVTGEAGVTVELAPGPDKYEAEPVVIDCQDRLPLCRAACCRLRFALSPQDVEEGIVQWEIPAPYLNRQRADGYCVHCDAGTGGCGIYENRPLVCRQYDCRSDTRIWADFERRIPSPSLVDLLAEPHSNSRG